MLTQIDACLHQAFPLPSTIPFGGCSIIILGDFGKLPPVKDTPMYAGSSIGTALWRTFDTFITLETISDNKEIVLLKLPFNNSC